MDTQGLIKTGLKELLKTLPYEEISITSLCSKVGISRRTFGRHYDSIDDVISVQIRDDFVEPIRQIRSLLPMDEIKSSSICLLSECSNPSMKAGITTESS